LSLPFRIEDSSWEEPADPAEPGMAAPDGVDEPADPGPRTSRFSRLLRFAPKTLSSRLVIGVVALLVVLLVILSGGTYFALRSFLYGRLDSQVNAAATQNKASLQRSLISQDDRIFLVPSGEKIWFSIIQSDGSTPSITLSQGNANSFAILDLSKQERAQFIAHPNVSTSLTSQGEPLRVESVALSDGNYLVLGLSTREVQRTLGRLLLLELIIGAAIVAIAAALTSWGVRAGLRPLRRVTRTAQEVTAELGPDGSGLSRRVPVHGATVEVEEVASAVNTLLFAVEAEFGARLRSEERMRQFLADASHELRTPLTSIRGYAELSRLQSSSGDAAEDAMRRIEVEGNRMSRLVEDLLVLARGDQGTLLRREPVEVDELLIEAATAVGTAYPDRQITVGPGTGLVVIGDWDQLLRVLINLTTNAAVHTPAGPIRLEAGGGPSPLGPAVTLRVTDSGPGLPPEEAAHVFERFWRADKARSRAKGGSGLGMAIVAQIVHTHGGFVQFDSSIERGTSVTVTLPMPAGYGPIPDYPVSQSAAEPYQPPALQAPPPTEPASRQN
jgi:two-component system OmpR family sensor kinase